MTSLSIQVAFFWGIFCKSACVLMATERGATNRLPGSLLASPMICREHKKKRVEKALYTSRETSRCNVLQCKKSPEPMLCRSRPCQNFSASFSLVTHAFVLRHEVVLAYRVSQRRSRKATTTQADKNDYITSRATSVTTPGGAWSSDLSPSDLVYKSQKFALLSFAMVTSYIGQASSLKASAVVSVDYY